MELQVDTVMKMKLSIAKFLRITVKDKNRLLNFDFTKNCNNRYAVCLGCYLFATKYMVPHPCEFGFLDLGHFLIPMVKICATYDAMELKNTREKI